MSLQQQIQREMQQEARIDKAIDGIMKRLLKQNENKKYRIVYNRKHANAMFVFNRSDLSNYSFILNDEDNEKLNKIVYDNRVRVIYLKNTNPHDSKNSTIGDIKNTVPLKSFILKHYIKIQYILYCIYYIYIKPFQLIK